MIFYPPAKHAKEIKHILKDSINQIPKSLKARNKATKHSNEISRKKKKHQKRIASKGNFPLNYGTSQLEVYWFILYILPSLTLS